MDEGPGWHRRALVIRSVGVRIQFLATAANRTEREDKSGSLSNMELGPGDGLKQTRLN